MHASANRNGVVRWRGARVADPLAALALVAAVAATAGAQPASSFSDLDARKLLKAGDTVRIEDAAGRTYEGRVQQIDDAGLTLGATADREAVILAERAVVRITRRPANRVGLGAMAGAGAGLAMTALAASTYGDNEGGAMCGACLIRWSLVGVPVGAGAGALIGLAMTRAGARTVFVARDPVRPAAVSVAPVVAPRAHGVVLSVRF